MMEDKENSCLLKKKMENLVQSAASPKAAHRTALQQLNVTPAELRRGPEKRAVYSMVTPVSTPVQAGGPWPMSRRSLKGGALPKPTNEEATGVVQLNSLVYKKVLAMYDDMKVEHQQQLADKNMYISMLEEMLAMKTPPPADPPCLPINQPSNQLNDGAATQYLEEETLTFTPGSSFLSCQEVLAKQLKCLDVQAVLPPGGSGGIETGSDQAIKTAGMQSAEPVETLSMFTPKKPTNLDKGPSVCQETQTLASPVNSTDALVYRHDACHMTSPLALKDTSVNPIKMNDAAIDNSPVHVGTNDATVGNSPLRVSMNDATVGNRPVHVSTNDATIGNSPVHVSMNDAAVSNSPMHVSMNDAAVGNSPVHVSMNDAAVGNSTVGVSMNDAAVGNSPVRVSMNDAAVGNSPVHVSMNDAAVGNSPVHVSMNDAAVGNSPVRVSMNDVAVGNSPVHVSMNDAAVGNSSVYVMDANVGSPVSTKETSTMVSPVRSVDATTGTTVAVAEQGQMTCPVPRLDANVGTPVRTSEHGQVTSPLARCDVNVGTAVETTERGQAMSPVMRSHANIGTPVRTSSQEQMTSPVPSKDVGVATSPFCHGIPRPSDVALEELDAATFHRQLETAAISNVLLREEVDKLQQQQHTAHLEADHLKHTVAESDLTLQTATAKLQSAAERQVAELMEQQAEQLMQIAALQTQLQERDHALRLLGLQHTQQLEERDQQRRLSELQLGQQLDYLQQQTNTLQQDLRLAYRQHKQQMQALKEEQQKVDYGPHYERAVQRQRELESQLKAFTDLPPLLQQLEQSQDDVQSLVAEAGDKVLHLGRDNCSSREALDEQRWQLLEQTEQLDKQLVALKDIKQLESDLITSTSTVSQLQNKVDALNTDMDVSEMEKTLLRDRCSELDTELMYQREVSEERQSKVVEHSHELSLKDERLSQMELELSELCESATAERQRQEQDKSELQHTLDAAVQDLDRVETERKTLARLVERHKTLIRSLERRAQEKDGLEVQVSKMQEQLHIVQSAAKETQEFLEEERNTLSEELQEKSIALNQALSQTQQLSQTNQQQQQQLEQLSEKQSVLQSELDSTKAYAHFMLLQQGDEIASSILVISRITDKLQQLHQATQQHSSTQAEKMTALRNKFDTSDETKAPGKASNKRRSTKSRRSFISTVLTAVKGTDAAVVAEAPGIDTIAEDRTGEASLCPEAGSSVGSSCEPSLCSGQGPSVGSNAKESLPSGQGPSAEESLPSGQGPSAEESLRSGQGPSAEESLCSGQSTSVGSTSSAFVRVQQSVSGVLQQSASGVLQQSASGVLQQSASGVLQSSSSDNTSSDSEPSPQAVTGSSDPSNTPCAVTDEQSAVPAPDSGEDTRGDGSHFGMSDGERPVNQQLEEMEGLVERVTAAAEKLCLIFTDSLSLVETESRSLQEELVAERSLRDQSSKLQHTRLHLLEDELQENAVREKRLHQDAAKIRLTVHEKEAELRAANQLVQERSERLQQLAQQLEFAKKYQKDYERLSELFKEKEAEAHMLKNAEEARVDKKGGDSVALAMHEMLRLRKDNLRLHEQKQDFSDEKEAMLQKCCRRIDVYKNNWEKAESEVKHLDRMVDRIRQALSGHLDKVRQLDKMPALLKELGLTKQQQDQQQQQQQPSTGDAEPPKLWSKATSDD